MKDIECAESKEKLNYRFFRFLFFEFWSFLVIFVLESPCEFHDKDSRLSLQEHQGKSANLQECRVIIKAY